MATEIEIEAGGVTLRGELGDSECARAVADVLPIRVRPSVWGEEFYFEIAVAMGSDETATSLVDVGTLGYWPTGNALCVFFGRTPMSTTDRPVPASDVNIVGHVDDARRFADVTGATEIHVRRVVTRS